MKKCSFCFRAEFSFIFETATNKIIRIAHAACSSDILYFDYGLLLLNVYCIRPATMSRLDFNTSSRGKTLWNWRPFSMPLPPPLLFQPALLPASARLPYISPPASFSFVSSSLPSPIQLSDRPCRWTSLLSGIKF